MMEVNLEFANNSFQIGILKIDGSAPGYHSEIVLYLVRRYESVFSNEL